MEKLKENVEIVAKIIAVAGDSPNVRQAGNELGQTALTITKAINNVLMPLAAVNFAIDKAKIYFQKQFEADLSAKLNEIPHENIVEPRASIVGPALQSLAFCHDEVNLKEMFISLLAAAMDKSKASSVHPSFVEIIKQLAAEEAHLLRAVLVARHGLPIVQARLKNAQDVGYELLMTHLMNLSDERSVAPVVFYDYQAYVDNWVRLGLAKVSYSTNFKDKTAYDWVETRPELIKFRADREIEGKKVIVAHGLIMRTSLGESFGKVIDIIKK